MLGASSAAQLIAHGPRAVARRGTFWGVKRYRWVARMFLDQLQQQDTYLNIILLFSHLKESN